MTKGKAPLYDEIGVPKELHHIDGRGGVDPHNIKNLMEVWPWEHADVDSFRHYNGPRPSKGYRMNIQLGKQRIINQAFEGRTDVVK